MLKTISLIVIAFFITLSCGGKGNSGFVHRHKSNLSKKNKKSIKKLSKANAKSSKFIQNPKWNTINEFFFRYSKMPITSMKDFIKSHLDKYMPKFDMPSVKNVEIVHKEIIKPLEKFPPEEYKLKIIISGTEVPKAILIDPDGNPHVVRKDTPVGNRQGVVESITDYQVIIKEPFKEKPVILSIEPEYLKWKDKYQFE